MTFAVIAIQNLSITVFLRISAHVLITVHPHGQNIKRATSPPPAPAGAAE